mmetsp:Transcript_9181/g.27633  ORF Transcript_9181/g.27633 Transcript_9181/m.27633 type:complete len:127 (+) Transcript_9181:193-573(+)
MDERRFTSVTTSRKSARTSALPTWFNGIGCGFGSFAFGIGYGAIFGGGVGYGPGMPYRRPTLFFGIGFGPFVGVGVGFGRIMGFNFMLPVIDWEEVILGQKSWGAKSDKNKRSKQPSQRSSPVLAE